MKLDWRSEFEPREKNLEVFLVRTYLEASGIATGLSSLFWETCGQYVGSAQRNMKKWRLSRARGVVRGRWYHFVGPALI